MKFKQKINIPLIIGGLAIISLVILLVQQGRVKGLFSDASEKGGVQEIVTSVYPPMIGTFKNSVHNDPTLGEKTIAPALKGGQDPWKEISSLPTGDFAERMTFLDANTGFLVGSRQVYKTTDAGHNWTPVLVAINNPPENFSGLVVKNQNEILIDGYGSGATETEGFVYKSLDGGNTWSPKTVLSTTDWLFDMILGSSNRLIASGSNLSNGIASVFINMGVSSDKNWTEIVPHPEEDGWFGHQGSAVGSRIDFAGTRFCTSFDNAVKWSCKPSVDPVFDGSVLFVDKQNGYVAGGEISPDSLGWIYKTKDGGKTWSEKLAQTPWAIRHILALPNNTIYASGGNAAFIGDAGGGIIASNDGGMTWRNSFNFGGEFRACAAVPKSSVVRCAGTTGDGTYTIKVFELTN